MECTVQDKALSFHVKQVHTVWKMTSLIVILVGKQEVEPAQVNPLWKMLVNPVANSNLADSHQSKLHAMQVSFAMLVMIQLKLLALSLTGQMDHTRLIP